MPVITLTIVNTDEDFFDAKGLIDKAKEFIHSLNGGLVVCNAEISESDDDYWDAFDAFCATNMVMPAPSLRDISKNNARASRLTLIQGGKK